MTQVGKLVTAVQDVELRCHLASSCAAISSIRVAVQRVSATQVQLSYRVAGDIAQIRIPAITDSERRDELWQHTCAELFVGLPGQTAYVEFNLSPSSCWAAYEFGNYRDDMRQASVDAPAIIVKQSTQLLQLDARVELPASFAATASLQASLTMVIEDHAGGYAYWAANHAAAKPDFHCRDSFIVNI